MMILILGLGKWMHNGAIYKIMTITIHFLKGKPGQRRDLKVGNKEVCFS